MLYSHSIYLWPTMLCVNISVGNQSRTNQLVIGLVITSWTVSHSVTVSAPKIAIGFVVTCQSLSEELTGPHVASLLIITRTAVIITIKSVTKHPCIRFGTRNVYTKQQATGEE